MEWLPASNPASDESVHLAVLQTGGVEILRIRGLRDSSTPDEWPRDLLDVDQLLAAGWKPQAFRQFILKIHSRCNLACDYCYVYRSTDQSWRDRPVRMSRATVSQTALRIAEHVHAHDLSQVGIVLHGGEPLLAGPDFITFLSGALRSSLPSDVTIGLHVQTNGTLLDDAILERLDEHAVRVGISIDGDVVANDRHRRHPDGRGTHGDVLAGIEQLRSRYRHLYAGLLCVVDPRSDPIATYEHLLSLEPPAVDFLLPHRNWSDPSAQPPAGGLGSYGDWLIAAFDRWYLGPGEETSVRLFEEIIRGLAGLLPRIESIGLAPARHIVVETDGTIEQVDALKSAYPGAAHTGLHINSDPFDAALLHPQVAARQIGVAALSDTCRQCDLREVCGGGFFPHRYRRGSGFRNPSVYCADLERLIRHVRSRVREDLQRCQLLVRT